jgi:hypothetical protein
MSFALCIEGMCYFSAPSFFVRVFDKDFYKKISTPKTYWSNEPFLIPIIEHEYNLFK